MKFGRIVRMLLWLSLLGLVVYLIPAVPVLLKWGTLPKMPDQRVNYLIAGVTPKYIGYHQRAAEDFGGLTDTILLLQFDPQSKSIHMLSIPRDTRVFVKGYGWGKINGANVHLGPQALVDTVEQLTHLRIQGYVLLSLSALREVTDALGGVELYVPKDMKYTDTAAGLEIDLKEGRQLLSGEQLEGFTRFRKDGMGDIGRVARQQEMLKAVLVKLKSPAGVLRWPSVARALDQNMKTNLDSKGVSNAFAAILTRPSLETETLPGRFANYGGTSFWESDPAALKSLLSQNFWDANQTDPRNFSIALMNVGAPDGSARKLKTKLESLGYQNVWITEPTDGEQKPTHILATPSTASGSRLLQSDIGYGEVQLGSVGIRGADILVRLGPDIPKPTD
ncbi:MAG: LCP family protein [Deinococcaceae bacterium]